MPDYVAKVVGGFNAGREMRQEMDTRKAMATLARSPDDPRALDLLAQTNPELAMQFQQRRQEQRKQQLSDVREKLTIMGRLMDGATPQDYAQRLQAAQSMGLDTSQVPPQFDPQWMAQTQMQVRALLGQVDQELMAVAPGTAVINKRTGKEVFKNPDRPRYYPIAPGGMLVPEPGTGGKPVGAGPQPGQVEDGYRFKGGNPADPNSWEPVGGQTPQASGPFQP